MLVELVESEIVVLIGGLDNLLKALYYEIDNAGSEFSKKIIKKEAEFCECLKDRLVEEIKEASRS